MLEKIEPKISIVIPIYKIPEAYLETCIRSLTNQTLQEIEIILVDDGSPDESGTICEQYKKLDNRIVVIHQENQGVSVARNTGMKHAKAKWISFVDADDWAEKDMMEQLYFYTTHVPKTVDIICCDCYANYEEKQIRNKFYTKQGVLSKEDAMQLQLQTIEKGITTYFPNESSIGVPWAKLYKKEFLIQKNLRFLPKMVRMQDAQFNLYAFEEAEQIAYYDIPLYHYRKNSSSIVNRYSPQTISYYEKFLDEVDKFIDKYNKGQEFIETRNIKVMTSIENYMQNYFFHKDNKKSRQEKKIEILELLQKKIYQKSLKTIKLQYLNVYQKIFLITLRIKNIVLLKLLFYIKTTIKKLKKGKLQNHIFPTIEVLISAMNIRNIDDWYIFLNNRHVTTKSVTINQITKQNIKNFETIDSRKKIFSYLQTGVSISRNQALQKATGDICMLADENIEYIEGYDRIVKQAYQKNPQADVIIFYIDIMGHNQEVKKIRSGKIGLINVMRVRTPEITFKRQSIIDNHICFDENFGPGHQFIKGEETIFIADCIKKGLKVISIPIKIATVKEHESTWFTGYHKEFIYYQGAIFGRIYPKINRLIALQYVIRKYSLYKENLNLLEAYKNIMRGIKDYQDYERKSK